jgi:hypothetical protein
VSYVTDVMLTCGDEPGPVGGINAWLALQGNGPLNEVSHETRTRKAFGKYLWIGGFNYLDAAGFVEQVIRADWRDPEDVQVWMCGDNQYRFTLVWPPDNREDWRRRYGRGDPEVLAEHATRGKIV